MNYAKNRARNSTLTAILVPITEKEIDGLASLFLIWQGYAELAAASGLEQCKCKLIVSLDCAPSNRIELKVNRIFKHLGLSRQFHSLRVAFCNIPPEDNIYIRNMDELPDTIPAFGLKSGPNIQFFRSMLDFCEEEDAVLLNEIDCFPVSRDWLISISQLVQRSEPFWILGSPYRGYGKLQPQIVSHINGNAINGVGSEGFRDVLMKFWQEGLLAAVPSTPGLAYDIFLEISRHELLNPSTWGNVPLEKFRFFSALQCKVRHTDLIHNLAGHAEISGQVKIDLADHLAINPMTKLVHGKFLYDQALQGMIDAMRRIDDSLYLSWSERAVDALMAVGVAPLANALAGVQSGTSPMLKYA